MNQAMERIIIIGGGGTGAALSHDLVLRGFKVWLLERGELLCGTTGRHHGLLHSGARYAVQDPEAARECIRENRILRRIAPQSLEPNDGLFVALNTADLEFRKPFVECCKACGIPVRQLSASQALVLEPKLSRSLKLAIQVPDATMDAWRLPLQFFATAKANGAVVKNFSEVTGLLKKADTVTGVRVLDHRNHREYDLQSDLVVNAAGAWAGIIAALAGIDVPVQPGPGVMLAVDARLTNMVINRLQPAGEGDIIVPQRRLSVLGTSLWLTDDPDAIDPPQDHAQMLFDRCAEMIPGVKEFATHSIWSAARPLIKNKHADNAQQISRTFDCYDHKVRDGIEGLISIIGGKATTLRAMAEKTADLICRKTGRSKPCSTRDQKLLHYRRFYHC
jgi:glycerol-3-phosphate dehydrogenase